MPRNSTILTTVDLRRTRTVKSKIRAQRIEDFWLGSVYEQVIHYPGNAGGTYHRDGPLDTSQQSALRRLGEKPPYRRMTHLLFEQPALFVVGKTQSLVVSVGFPQLSQWALIRARGRLKGRPTLLGFAGFLARVCELGDGDAPPTVHTLEGRIAPVLRTFNSPGLRWRMVCGHAGLNGIATDDEERPWFRLLGTSSLISLALELSLTREELPELECLEISDIRVSSNSLQWEPPQRRF